MSIVSDNIKYLRRVNKLTQELFAQKIGIKRSLLGAYEEGRANPNLGNLMNIAKIFGISVDNLIQDDLSQLDEAPRLVPTEDESVNELSNKAIKSEKTLPSTVDKRSQQSTLNQFHTTKQTARQINPISSAPKENVLKLKGDVQEEDRKGQVTLDDSKGINVSTPNGSYLNKKESMIGVVRQQGVSEYLLNYSNPNYLQNLSLLHLPWFGDGIYRAFELGADFVFPNAVVIGQYINNWYDLVDGKNHIVVLKQKSVLYRRVYNQLRIKGVLLLSSDQTNIPSTEIAEKDVLEIWEAKSFISNQLPEPAISLDRLAALVAELQQEIERLKK